MSHLIEHRSIYLFIYLVLPSKIQNVVLAGHEKVLEFPSHRYGSKYFPVLTHEHNKALKIENIELVSG